jgi:hypothetical protein
MVEARIMFGIRTHLIVSGALFAAMIALAGVGTALQRAGMPPPVGAWRSAYLACWFALFLVFGLSMIPVMVKLVVLGQQRLGNGDVPIVAAAK